MNTQHEPLKTLRQLVLEHLRGKKGMSAGAIGKDIGKEPSNVHRVCQDLMAAGLVEGEQSPVGKAIVYTLVPLDEIAAGAGGGLRDDDEDSEGGMGGVLRDRDPTDPGRPARPAAPSRYTAPPGFADRPQAPQESSSPPPPPEPQFAMAPDPGPQSPAPQSPAPQSPAPQSIPPAVATRRKKGEITIDDIVEKMNSLRFLENKMERIQAILDEK